jgi:hypothetical protein
VCEAGGSEESEEERRRGGRGGRGVALSPTPLLQRAQFTLAEFVLPLPTTLLTLPLLILLLLLVLLLPLPLLAREPRLHRPEARERALDGAVGRLAARVVPALRGGLVVVGVFWEGVLGEG